MAAGPEVMRPSREDAAGSGDVISQGDPTIAV